jgi:argininosuccinate lyase
MGDWRLISPHFGDDIVNAFNFEQSVASRDVAGGTSPRSIKAQIKQVKRLMNAVAQRNGEPQ